MEKSLENKLEEKPDWKQWLPVYGIYELIKDGLNKRPIVNPNSALAKYTWVIYQSASIIYLVEDGIPKFIEKIF